MHEHNEIVLLSLLLLLLLLPLPRGATIDEVNDKGNTPLMNAIYVWV